MTQDLVIVGAGGFAREAAAVVHAINDVRPTWRLLGFVDDDPALHGTTRSRLPILGGLDRLAEMPETQVVVGVVSPRHFTARAQVVERLGLPESRFATLIHPSAQIGAGCQIGPGSVLLAQVALTTDAILGAHVLVMPQAVITHDDMIGDYTTITSGVRLGGGVVVGEGAYLGSGSIVRELVTVGAWSLIGMGAVVLRDVPPGEVWVGNPARHLRSVQLPAAATTHS
jgi:sugar O-acyltransferase (sialic acid O-acetyltransferase NeuD family)